jgi:hypothetical protein
MIDGMASLKQAMEQMDAEDPTVAQAAKDRAGQILSDAKLSFSKLGDLIEQHRLLLRPRIVASIKRMDQPAMLGDSAFRDTTASLRKEGQSFRQIAEALELRGGTEPPIHESLRQHALTHFDDEPEEAENRASPSPVIRVITYPFRHPIQILAIAVLTVMLINGLREFAASDHPIDARRVGDTAARRQAAASSSSAPPANSQAGPSSSASSPAGSAEPSASPQASTTPSATEPAPAVPANPSATAPPASTSTRDPKSPLPSTASGDRTRTYRLRSLGDFMPAQLRRSSRYAGPCRGGIGGCYWGGGQY